MNTNTLLCVYIIRSSVSDTKDLYSIIVSILYMQNICTLLECLYNILLGAVV